ncbi:hypothetical protein SteCoe_13250 [Stentor coeruleus]|uniref:Uncharacterized protein n=1 Tax=Stentor coeruleus TaxID=5963 RepID=A0A1R2C8S3_9CILI|nr:hypothetical protein SteCoe_13250 [Stentor coeruleus]
MDRFKIASLSRNPSSYYNHARRKSDQVSCNDNSINWTSLISNKKLTNPGCSNQKAGIIIKNLHNRSNSGDVKKNVSLDLSKIRIIKNVGSCNNSARNPENLKLNIRCMRKKSGDFTMIVDNTDRMSCKENIKPEVLESAPNVQMLCSNRFIDKISLYEDRLMRFYARNRY